jgi:DNA invertase Pin-like site-specific DNA recombinase
MGKRITIVGTTGRLHGWKMADIIAYFRDSTKQQGESGLGLEAQVAAVQAYARQTGATIKGSYVEVESGKRIDRPELAKALAHARRNKGTLVVAKLDRLARNVAFLSALMDSKVPFVACDNPHANRLTLHILAAVAEAEAVAISQRINAALAAYKARGGKLGADRPQCRNLTPAGVAKGRARSVEVRKSAAAEAYRDLLPLMQELCAKGLSLKAIADELGMKGHKTGRGRPMNAVQVQRVLARAS